MFEVIPKKHELVSAVVRVPPVSSTIGDTDEQSVFTYPAWWLALHALSRMVDAEDALKALRNAMHMTGRLNQHEHSVQPTRVQHFLRLNQAQHSAKEKARTEWLLALLELAHLYRIDNRYLERSLFPERWDNIVLDTVAKSALEHNLELAEHGRPPLFHRIWQSLAQHTDRPRLEVPTDPILDGTFSDWATALSDFLRDKCKDPINLARSDWVDSTEYFAHFALYNLAEQVGCP